MAHESKYRDKVKRREQAPDPKAKQAGGGERRAIARKAASHLQEQYDRFREDWDSQPTLLKREPHTH